MLRRTRVAQCDDEMGVKAPGYGACYIDMDYKDIKYGIPIPPRRGVGTCGDLWGTFCGNDRYCGCIVSDSGYGWSKL